MPKLLTSDLQGPQPGLGRLCWEPVAVPPRSDGSALKAELGERFVLMCLTSTVTAALSGARAIGSGRRDGRLADVAGVTSIDVRRGELGFRPGAAAASRASAAGTNSSARAGASRTTTASRPDPVRFPERQRGIPRSSRRRSPEAPARARQFPQHQGRKALATTGIPAYPRSARKRQDRPVTPEVAGSSPVAPVKVLQIVDVFDISTAGFFFIRADPAPESA